MNWILPYIVARRTAVSPKGLDRLLFSSTCALIDRGLDLERACRAAAPALCDTLASAIGMTGLPRCHNSPGASALLQLRRDIYNDRAPAQQVVALARDTLAVGPLSSAMTPLDEWIAMRREREHARDALSISFADERRRTRAALKRLVRHRQFRKALALATPVLSRGCREYTADGEDLVSARVRRIERSLVRYYTRCAVKVSPFSSFSWTTLWRVERCPRPRTGSAFTRRDRTVTRSVQINRTIVGNLARHVAGHDVLGGYVPVCWGVAHLEASRELIVLQRRYGESRATLMNLPHEAIAVLPASRVLQLVTECLEMCGGNPALNNFVQLLGQHVGGAARAKTYARRLIDLGVLVHKIPLPIAETSVLDTFARVLARMPSRTAAAVAALVREWEEARLRFAAADDEERCRLLQLVDNGIAHAFALLRAPYKRPSAALMYEDCLEGAIHTVAVERSWEARFRELHQLMWMYGDLFDVNLSIRDTVRDALQRYFGGGPVRVLAFIADERRRPVPADTGQVREDYLHTPNVRHFERIDRLARVREEMSAVFAAPSLEPELDIGVVARQRGWLARVRDIGLHASLAPALCASCYGQPYRAADGSVGFVLNQIGGGPARAVLRASAALPAGPDAAQLLATVRSALERVYAPAEPCEITAHHEYNANLHPRATRRVVDYADHSGPAEDTLSVADLSLSVDADGRVLLTHAASGRQLAPLTLGQMADSFAPPVQRLFFGLGHAWMLSSKPFHPSSWPPHHQTRPVERYPRLVLGGCVVRRRGWSVLKSALPHRHASDGDVDYFTRVRRWRQESELPEEVFVYASLYMDPVHDRNGGRRQWNNRKPQYVDFRNAVLVDVFARLLNDVKDRLYVEEMLPTREGWQGLGLRRPTELVCDVILRRDDMPAQCDAYGADPSSGVRAGERG